MTKATHKKTTVDLLKNQKRQQKKAFGLGRQNLTGYTDAAGGFTTMHQVSTASSGGSNSSSFLKTSGGTMIGPLAFWMGNELIYPTTANNNTLNLTPTEGAYTSHWVWAAAGSKELEIITNNDPDTAFSGQILFIESVDTETPKIIDRSNTSGGTTGNIKTLDGNDYTFPSNKTIILFMFSSIDNLWHQISNPSTSGSAMQNPATAQLDMATFSIEGNWDIGGGQTNFINVDPTVGIEADLDMNSYDVKDVCRLGFELGGSDLADEVAGITASTDRMHFNVPTGDEFAFTVDGAASPEVIINYVDVRLQNYLRFDNHTSGTNQVLPSESDGYINIKIGSSVRKLYYYT